MNRGEQTTLSSSHWPINVWYEKCISAGQSKTDLIKPLGHVNVFPHALQHGKWLKHGKYPISDPLTVFIPVELFDLQ